MGALAKSIRRGDPLIWFTGSGLGICVLMILGLILVAMLGPSMHNIIIAIALTSIPPFARIARAPTIAIKEREFVMAGRALGYSDTRIVAGHILPNILPGILSGVALAFAKAVGEFGSLVIITGNLPYKTEVSSVYIFGRIESGDGTAAAAAAVVLLVISFGVLLSIGVIRHVTVRHDRA